MTYQASYLPEQSAALKTQFFAEVELGMPSRKCINFGICSISPLESLGHRASSTADLPQEGCCCRKLEAVVSVLKDDTVELCFLKHNIRENVLNKHFGRGVFRVEEDFTFSHEDESDIKFQIKRGDYPISRNTTLLTVLFN